MIIVTGGAGFIGSNLVKTLNAIGEKKIIIVDNLNHFKKKQNLTEMKYDTFISKDEFLNNNLKLIKNAKTVFHQGACSDTTNIDKEYMNNNNFVYSKKLLNECLEYDVPFIYASSAAVYGLGEHGFKEIEECEKPLNLYALSKLNFDNYVREVLKTATSQIVGLRYFNVFGPLEFHKNKMASVMYHFYNQLISNKIIKIFKGDRYINDGEHMRDFIHVKNCIDVNLFFNKHRNLNGIYNVGMGEANSYNSIANILIKKIGYGNIEYINFPKNLIGKYQNYTKADISKLLEKGFQYKLNSFEESVISYCDWLEENN